MSYEVSYKRLFLFKLLTCLIREFVKNNLPKETN